MCTQPTLQQLQVMVRDAESSSVCGRTGGLAAEVGSLGMWLRWISEFESVQMLQLAMKFHTLEMLNIVQRNQRS